MHWLLRAERKKTSSNQEWPMAWPSPHPMSLEDTQIVMCQKRERLFQYLAEAAAALVDALHLQTDAILAGDVAFERFDALIETARQCKEKAHRAYEAHVRYHGCHGTTRPWLLPALHSLITGAPVRTGRNHQKALACGIQFRGDYSRG
jgi:hypothetical protein